MKNNSGFKTLFSIILCNLVCAGLLLVNNSSSWDSLLLTNAYDFGNNEAMKNCIFNTGRRTEYFIALLIFHFPYWVMLLKVLSFALLVGIQYFIYKILETIFDDNHEFNLLLSICIINFPLYVLWLEPIMFSYTICEFLFFAAIYFYFRQTFAVVHITTKHPLFLQKAISFIPIAFLLFWSFEVQSFYVFIYAFLLVLFFRQYQKNIATKAQSHQEINQPNKKPLSFCAFVANPFWSNVIRFIKQHYLLILFPIFSFWLWNKLFPINGMAKVIGYNQINLSIKSMAYHFAFSNFKLLIALPYLLLQMAFHNPITTVVSCVGAFIVFRVVFRKTFNPFAAWRDKNNLTAKEIQHKDDSITIHPSSFIIHRLPLWLILSISLVFLITALLPYNVVGKDYGALNRNCRNGLLAGFSIVFLIVMLIEKYVASNRLRFYLFAALFALFAIGSNLSYMYWQAYYVRFQKTQELFAANVSRFKSNYIIVTESGNNPMHQHFTSYEMNFMLKEKVRSEQFLTMESTSNWANKPNSFLKITQGYRRIFMYNDFNNKTDSAVQITLQSTPNAMFDAERIVWNYWMNGCDAKDYPMQLTINDDR